MRVYSDAFVNNNIYGGAASAFTLLVMTVGATVIVNVVGNRISRRSAR
jgi:multiple sugar transport system permease protein